MIALSPTGNKGLGVFSVKGRKRSPFPPAISTASTGSIDFIFLKSYIATNLCSQFNTGTKFIFRLLNALNFSILSLSESRKNENSLFMATAT